MVLDWYALHRRVRNAALYGASTQVPPDSGVERRILHTAPSGLWLWISSQVHLKVSKLRYRALIS